MLSRTSRYAAMTILPTLIFLSGCDLTLGPKVKTEYLFIHAGVPCRVVDDVTVRVRLDKENAATVKQNIGGWVVLHPDHFEKLMNAATGQ